MVAKITAKAEAWIIFDRIVALAAPEGKHSNPWVRCPAGKPHFEPDYDTLERLLGVPLYLKAGTQSGVPALALDVWLSYELRRAGFNDNQVWPRPVNPRIYPAAVAALIESLPKKLKADVQKRVFAKTSIKGVTSSSANILGKNYVKQVDVVITDWATGPELLVSTKRMDSSYGKNAPNRIEESYGDAKNLRLRHPLAALGFVFGLRSDILQKEPKTALWLFDLLGKLGREDDAYHATCLILMEYSGDVASPEAESGLDSTEIPDPGPESEEEEEVAAGSIPEDIINQTIENLPKVRIVKEHTPVNLVPGLFLTAMVTRVLDTTPVNMHEEARARLASLSGIPATASAITP